MSSSDFPTIPSHTGMNGAAPAEHQPACGPTTRVSRLIKLSLETSSTLTSRLHLNEALATSQGMNPYIDSISSGIIIPRTHSVAESEVRDIIGKLFVETERMDWARAYREGKTKWELSAGMCAGPYEASVLQHILLTSKGSRVLEIGVFTGTTALCLALLPQVEKVVGLEIEPFSIEFAKPYWKGAGVESKINAMVGDALVSLSQLHSSNQQFDLIFIDANKTGYSSYYRSIMDYHLLAADGIILADNTLYKGYPYSASDTPVTPTSAIQSNNKSHAEATQGIIDFNNLVRADNRVDVVVLPIRDGISMIRRKI